MPYRRNNYSFTIDSNFTPFTMQEMLVPFTMYKDAFEKTEEAYNELSTKAGDFKYLAKSLPEGSKSREIYEGYAKDLEAQARDLSQNGLSMGNRRALTELKRRYSGEIGRLEKANLAMEEERKLRRANKDTSMLYATDNLNIDDFLDGANPNLYGISGEDLRKEAAQYAAASSSRIYGNTRVQDINKYFQDIIQTQGYSPEVLAAWRQNLESIPEFNQAIEDIMTARGVTGNLTGVNYERARQNVINGIMEGSVYQEKRSSHQNPGVLTAAQAASNALGWANHNETVRQHNLQLRMAGYDENGVYHPENDQTLKKAKEVAKVKSSQKGNSTTPKTSKVDLLENESYDTNTGYSGPAPSGVNATYGKEITLAEAMEEAPDLVAATGEMRNYYRYYKNGTKITRRRVHSSVTPETEEDAQPTAGGTTSGGTTTGNGSNHNAL